VLKPMVSALAGEPGLGGWEIVNEPEGSVAAAVADAEPCYDTTALTNTGAGWAQPDAPIPMKQVLYFVGVQAAAIHATDPLALVTVGAWSEHSSTDNRDLGRQDLYDYYKPSCLEKATGDSNAFLDFYQVHSYASKGRDFQSTSAFRQSKAAYLLAGPVVIGEFSPGDSADGETAEQLYTYAHQHGFDGAWGWTVQDNPLLFGGMASLRSEADVAVVQLPHSGDPDTCDCSDIPPDPVYTCAQQEEWGKCGEDWMAGLCCRSCHACSPDCTKVAAATFSVSTLAISTSARREPDWPHADYRAYVEAAQAAALVRDAASVA